MQLLEEIRSSGSVLVGPNDAEALGELCRAGYSVRGVLPRNTKVRDIADLIDKGFDEYTIR